MCVYMYIYIYIHIHTHRHTYIHTYTHPLQELQAALRSGDAERIEKACDKASDIDSVRTCRKDDRAYRNDMECSGIYRNTDI